MNANAYIAYFEMLARQHAVLLHNPEAKRRSFFAIADSFDLQEFDNALKNNPCQQVLFLESAGGFFSDNGGKNYTHHTNLNLMVVGKVSTTTIHETQNVCFQIGIDLIARIRADQRTKAILSNTSVYLEEAKLTYDTVGPIQTNFHGYIFSLAFCSPFHWRDESRNWL